MDGLTYGIVAARSSLPLASGTNANDSSAGPASLDTSVHHPISPRRSSIMPRVLPLLLAKLATLSMALAAADMMILTQIPTIAMARMDPIVNPGEVSSHVHNVLGASNFGRESD